MATSEGKPFGGFTVTLPTTVQSPGVMEYESASLAYPLLPPMEPSAPPYVPYPPPANSDSYAAPAPSAPPGDGWLVAGESKGGEPSTDVKHAPGSVPEVIEHIVMQSDTLQGICLRYNVTLRELKRWNQFPRENFRILRKLKIPVVKGARPLVEHTKDEIVYDFAKTHGITRAEAKFYLDEADFNVVDAKAAVRSDVAWEKGGRVPETVLPDSARAATDATAGIRHRVKQ